MNLIAVIRRAISQKLHRVHLPSSSLIFLFFLYFESTSNSVFLSPSVVNRSVFFKHTYKMSRDLLSAACLITHESRSNMSWSADPLTVHSSCIFVTYSPRLCLCLCLHSRGDPEHQLRGDGAQFSVSTSTASCLQTLLRVPGQVLGVPLWGQLL